jgi:hypothetical protein
MYKQEWDVEIGVGYSTGVDLLKILERAHVKTNADTYAILGNTQFRTCYRTCTEPRGVTLARITPRSLGCKETMLKGEFYHRVEKNGYTTVHPDAGIFLRIQYLSQNIKDKIFIGMNPLRHPISGRYYTFLLTATERNALCLHTVPMDYDTTITMDDTFVFCTKKK